MEVSCSACVRGLPRRRTALSNTHLRICLRSPALPGPLSASAARLLDSSRDRPSRRRTTRNKQPLLLVKMRNHYYRCLKTTTGPHRRIGQDALATLPLDLAPWTACFWERSSLLERLDNIQVIQKNKVRRKAHIYGRAGACRGRAAAGRRRQARRHRRRERSFPQKTRQNLIKNIKQTKNMVL